MKTTKFNSIILFLILLIEYSYAISKSKKTNIEKSDINQLKNNNIKIKKVKTEVFLGVPPPKNSPTYIPSSRQFIHIEEEIEKEIEEEEKQLQASQSTTKLSGDENKNMNSTLSIKYGTTKIEHNRQNDKLTPSKRLSSRFISQVNIYTIVITSILFLFL
jgi:lipopolysaccharide export LptBFGC system permease protein LptF